MKPKSLSTILFICTIFFACNKDKVEGPRPDFSHLEGNFLGSFVEDNSQNQTGTHLITDRVICLDVTGDTLHFLDCDFIINSEDQTFFYATTSTPNKQILLAFSDNYNFIYFNDNYAGLSPDYNKFNATRTSLEVTPELHENQMEIVGLYDMEVIKTNTNYGLDTSYSSTLFVDLNSIGFNLDSNEIEVYNPFISSHYFFSYVSGYGNTLKLAEWRNDSIFITIDEISTVTYDTVSFSYIGKHL